MRLVASSDTLEHVRALGGAVYVWPRGVRCCGGRKWMLEASTQPSDRVFQLVHSDDGIDVFATPGLAQPHELHLDLRRGRRLEAYWNGQSWIG